MCVCVFKQSNFGPRFQEVRQGSRRLTDPVEWLTLRPMDKGEEGGGSACSEMATKTSGHKKVGCPAGHGRPLTGRDGAGLPGRACPQPCRWITVRILLPPPPAVDPPPPLALRRPSSPPAVLIWKCARPDARLCLLATGAPSRFLPIWLRFPATRRKRQPSVLKWGWEGPRMGRGA